MKCSCWGWTARTRWRCFNFRFQILFDLAWLEFACFFLFERHVTNHHMPPHLVKHGVSLNGASFKMLHGSNPDSTKMQLPCLIFFTYACFMFMHSISHFLFFFHNQKIITHSLIIQITCNFFYHVHHDVLYFLMIFNKFVHV